ncbi:MAG: 2-hydroxyacyl-CoA dehydratase [Deltaproteobacteria bacterium]|nr:2-hydroxyacyl-CoA dehydratase [Deltaproteobacteria bacterium]MBW2015321.1 2-hydroxyacyl-CoA dehydratase [Deltaproteobacteria bacterium]
MSDIQYSEATVGLTSTIPVEIVLAAGLKPLDLNNIFITSSHPEKLISRAESDGFGHSVCSWIKGIYGAVLEYDIKRVIAVTGGDCSNTVALGEVLERRGVEVLHFEYPLRRDRASLMDQMNRLRRDLSATWQEVEKIRLRLMPIREKLRKLDRLTYEKNVITGFENHLFLVSSSDFYSDLDRYEKELDALLTDAGNRRPMKEEIRLGYLGVPPIFNSFYERIESLGARVVFNETQRQFSMPAFQDHDLCGQYLTYTYPYGIQGRIDDILQAVSERNLDGLIHYTQTFCYRQIYDILLRESLPVPILTLEGDRPGPVDSRTALRLETFVHMLKDRKYD